jgi:soluble cytochrome b562
MKKSMTMVVRFRCTPEEYNKIVKMAKPYGSMSKLLRECLFSKKHVFIDPKTFLHGMDALTTAMNRVGNNVNQIAKFVNATKDVNDYALMQQWFEHFTEYKNILRNVRVVIQKFYMKQ